MTLCILNEDDEMKIFTEAVSSFCAFRSVQIKVGSKLSFLSLFPMITIRFVILTLFLYRDTLHYVADANS